MNAAIIILLALIAACGSSDTASKPADTKPEEARPAAKPAETKPEAKPEAKPAPAPIAVDAAPAPAPDATPVAAVEVPTTADFEDRVRDVTTANLELHLRELEDELAP